ncbi:uncharacterized protein LOC112557361 [Pomacea canaliculata]|uniref:uncharacterized protein LOC112557361 n=1 Tax=Pomacea canaliculata TaxID=400727 RepID=UPI000D73E7F6|nr:uncharacterized protein LOC112557361 [Pomacea canaliculata]
MPKVMMVTQDIETLDIAGRILGSSACLMSWLASATDVWRTHKSGCSARRHAWAEMLMAVGNTGYLVIVFCHPSFTPGVVSYTLPWTLARAGLAIFNVTTLVLLFLGGHRQFYQKLSENGDCLSLKK